MNPTIKQKWVDALRSGKYEQGQWKLTRIDDYTDIMGEGKRENLLVSYSFSVENVREFANFLMDCGGFEIW